MLDHPTPLADWVVILPVVLCLLGAAVLLMLRAMLPAQRWIGLAIVLTVLACDVVLFTRVMDAGPLSMTMGRWLPPFGISFTADVLGVGFALAGALATLCVLLYLQSGTPEAAVRDGIYPLILLLLAGVSGAFLTGDLFNLYVWFEVMLIASFGLMVLAGHPLQLDAAVKYGVLNFIATTLFLMALGLLYGLVGTLNMADIVGAASRADAAPLTAIAALFALAFGMKAAVFPVNAWLPASYHTPPPGISALMGGLLTKVGVYAMLRTLVMLLPVAREQLGPVLLAAAIATAILGPLSAIGETNLRRSVGFMLIGGVGLMLLSLSGVEPFAIAGSIAYGIHAIFTVTALYLVAGLIEGVTGQVDTRYMRGLYANNSGLSVLFLVLILAISGVPPFLGFWPKLLLLQGFESDAQWLPLFVVLLNALLTLVAGTRLWSHIFWRGAAEKAALPFRAHAAAWVLTAVIVALGLAPSLLIDTARVAAQDLLQPGRYVAAVGLAP